MTAMKIGAVATNVRNYEAGGTLLMIGTRASSAGLQEHSPRRSCSITIVGHIISYHLKRPSTI
jgi:hypothetical protein